MTTSQRSAEAPLLARAAPLIAAAYLIGALVCLLRLGAAVWGGHRLRRCSRPVDEPALLQLVAEQSRRVGLRLAPVVAYCERVAAPTVVGILRPMVLLPASLLTGLTPEQAAAILSHELAHLRRGDLLMNLLQRLIESLLFFHPAVWYLSRRMSAEREACCDDLVVASGHERLRYVDALLRMAELCSSGRQPDAMALAASGSSLSQFETRIRRLLHGEQPSRLRLTRAGLLCTVLLAVSLAVLPVAYRNLVLAQGEPAAPRIKISKQTTRIVAPLDKDGRVDYVAALEAQFSAGVTPENNAAAPLFANVGMQPEGPSPEETRKEFFERLGVAAPPEGREPYVNARRFIKEMAMGGEAAYMAAVLRFNDQDLEATRGPWSRETCPDIALWLAKNEAALDAIAEGLKRPKYYLPLLVRGPAREGEEVFTKFAVLPVEAETMRELSRIYMARAMLRLQEGQIDDARADVMAIHRLARHMARAPTLIESFVALAIEGMACHGEVELAASGKLEAEQLRAQAAEMAALPQTFDVIGAVDLAERYLILEHTIELSQGVGLDKYRAKLRRRQDRFRGPIEALFDAPPIDWNETLRICNRRIDQSAAAARKPTAAESAAAFKAIYEQWDRLAESTRDPKALLERIERADNPTQQKGRMLGECLVAETMVAVQMGRNVQLRELTWDDLARLTLLLEAYRAEQGAYPETLDQLVPKYLDKLPRDRYTGGSLVYRRSEAGVRVYSVGPNGKDDDGTGHGIGVAFADSGESDDVFIPPLRRE